MHTTVVHGDHNWGSHTYYNETYCSLTCEDCGKVVYSTHATRTSSSSATCTSSGYEETYCENCGYVFSSSTTPALGHNWGSYTTVTSATCTTAGSQKRTCSRCSTSQTTTISALGHSWGSYTVITPATCTTAGSQKRSCTRSGCSESETATINAIGHNYTGTCPLCGTANVVCTNAGCSDVKTHTCDTTPPTVSFGTNGNTKAASSVSTKVTITDASEINTSSLKYQWTQSTVAPAENTFTQSFTNGQTITLSGKNGKWYLWILAKDSAGNTAIVSSGAFELDNEAPDGTIDIVAAYEKAGIKYTSKENVTINLTATDNVSTSANIKVALINENNFSLTNPNSSINWLDFSATKTWTLSSNSGMKTVYVIFKDEAGNQSLYLAQ